MEETKYCQSCGMPLQKQEEFGTNRDGSKNEEYCRCCFENGAFTADYTMEQMIGHCAQFIGEFNKDAGTAFAREEAIVQVKASFPTLKRWKVR